MENVLDRGSFYFLQLCSWCLHRPQTSASSGKIEDVTQFIHYFHVSGPDDL